MSSAVRVGHAAQDPAAQYPTAQVPAAQDPAAQDPAAQVPAASEQDAPARAALAQDAKDLNLIASFVVVRNVPELTARAVDAKLGGPADIAVLFGGGGPATADALAAAMKAQVATGYVIAGVHGHTTSRVYDALSARLPQGAVSPEDSEAEMLDAYLRHRYGLSADLLEKASTNCGSNVINLLSLLAEKHIDATRFVLIHDAPFQRRISATMELEAPEASWVNLAAWRAKVGVKEGRLTYLEAPEAMWSLDHYRSLLLGEVRRLWDTPEGYGPRGSHFLAHVEVPDEVIAAYRRLCARYPEGPRP